MKVGFYQFDVGRSLDENAAKIDRVLSRERCDLLLLPELCSCGYLFESREALAAAAEPVPDGEAARTFLALSEKHRCALIAGLPERCGKRIYNSAMAAENGKFVGCCRKTHLSDLEKRFFDPGDGPGVFSLCGRTVGVQICFDLWFPEICRAERAAGAELFCVLANFGSKPTSLISRVRAMENLVPLLLCNRVGSEHLGGIDADFVGLSSLTGWDGTRLIPEQPAEERFCTAEIQLPPPAGNVICSDFSAEIARK